VLAFLSLSTFADGNRIMIALQRLFAALAFFFALFVSSASIACADADAARAAGVDPTTVGMQPITGPIPIVTPMPGESSLKLREDGSNNAIPANVPHLGRSSRA
jgi:hypothetical protein